MSEYAAGDKPASPTPTPMRVKNNDQKLLAMLQALVKMLHTTTQAATRLRRLRVSAKRPSGSPITV